jgi:3-isopropylmalate/(R)-2-methylmalate dehydratase large subunit
MNFKPGMKLEGQKNRLCISGKLYKRKNRRFQGFASVIKGRKKADTVTALIVPGSKMVENRYMQKNLTSCSGKPVSKYGSPMLFMPCHE